MSVEGSSMKQKRLCLALFAILIPPLFADEVNHLPQEVALEERLTALDDIQVIAKISDQPNIQYINPKEAIQPAPVQDGTELLRLIPNMSVARKGGGGGEPIFRGLGGSRLRILSNDHQILGGCGGRMDPPTAYIYPESYDEVIFIKGPQTVKYGPGNIAGVARFIRNDLRFDQPTAKLSGSLLGGSFDRIESYVDGIIGNEWGWIHANATYNRSHDYKDGAGDKIHSKYKRDSQTIEAGLTPTENTLIEIGYDRSRGHTYYADRMMDGIKFDRDSWRFRVKQENITDWLRTLQFEYSHNKIDHVMDNYTYRISPKMFAVSNPARTTQSAKLFAELSLGDHETTVGIDWLDDRHKLRMTGMKPNLAAAANYHKMPYQANQKFKNWGIFIEDEWFLNDSQKLVMGYRHDRYDAKYNPDFGKGSKIAPQFHSKRYNLDSAFLRYEHRLGDWLLHAGYGMAQRAPDFWERSKDNGERLKKETNHEIDLGVIFQNETLAFSTTLFASKMKDYILIQEKAARNIDADRYGIEAQVQWNMSQNWRLSSSIAYTYGKNKTDNRPLAQVPPLEWNSSLQWHDEQFSAGIVWRVVNSQHRYAKGQGNIFGTDIGRGAGYGTVALNASWKVRNEMTIMAGVDNLFNKNYAEFISRGTHDIAGYNVQNKTRINEPGRSLWVRMNIDL
ncbi:TonB-dependent copper receptor [Ignatzschineria indica]|nr:TonB-dependent copper receptor [Ignatzschineria indica]